jgi:phage tail-like protein
MPQRRDDPYLNFNFRLEIDSLEVAGFSEVHLGGAVIEPVAYREGTDAVAAARLLPGRVSYDPVVLRKGFAGDPSLFRWWLDVSRGLPERRAVEIVLEDEQHRDVARWVLRRAWPTKWVGPELRGLGNDVAIETLELVHEGIELVD